MARKVVVKLVEHLGVVVAGVFGDHFHGGLAPGFHESETLDIAAQEGIGGRTLSRINFFVVPLIVISWRMPSSRMMEKRFEPLLLGGVGGGRGENSRRGLFAQHGHCPLRLTRAAELHEAYVFFFQSRPLQHFQHVAIGRAGGIERESLAAQIFEAGDARMGHQDVVADDVVLSGDENAVAAARDQADQPFGATLIQIDSPAVSADNMTRLPWI